MQLLSYSEIYAHQLHILTQYSIRMYGVYSLLCVYVYIHLFDSITAYTLVLWLTALDANRKRSSEAHLNCRHLFPNTCIFCQLHTHTNCLHPLNTLLTMLLLICFVIDFECGKKCRFKFSCI